MLLRDTRRTVLKAEAVIDDIDKSVKSGIDKASAMQAPLAALATTTTALNGMMRGATSLKDMTKTVISASRIIRPTGKTNTNMEVNVKSTDNNFNSGNYQQNTATQPQTVNSTNTNISQEQPAQESTVNSVSKTVGSAAIPNDFSVNELTNNATNMRLNEGTKDASNVKMTSLAENITTVTPPDGVNNKEETKKKKRRVKRPRFFRKR